MPKEISKGMGTGKITGKITKDSVSGGARVEARRGVAASVGVRLKTAIRPILVAWFGLHSVAVLSDDEDQMLLTLAESQDTYADIAMQIWDHAELGYQEHKSSQLLQDTLANAGFKVEAGVANIPTAFVASYGEGQPVIGILAEFDALPGISQAAVPIRQGLPGKAAGHACGHHLFGAGSTAAAIAVKDWLADTPRQGTIRLYGTPAEEGGSGKVYMVRAGLFDDVDTVLHWHAGDRNAANPGTTLANKSARIQFTGVSSHAAAAPERGRSALDGVEAMNHMVNLMREHLPDSARVHYVITSGGKAPNVVPDFAEVYYYVRHPDAKALLGIWDRVMNTAHAAALGTGTSVNIETMHGNHAVLPNDVLARTMYDSLSRVGGYTMSPSEQQFAAKIAESFGDSAPRPGLETQIQPFRFQQGRGSTDVGDVSWVVPTTGLTTATWVPGTAAHSWQAIAAGGTSIGVKGMMVAAKSLALTARTLISHPTVLTAAQVEFDRRRGSDYVYRALLGDREPPLNYRKVSQ